MSDTLPPIATVASELARVRLGLILVMVLILLIVVAILSIGAQVDDLEARDRRRFTLIPGGKAEGKEKAPIAEAAGAEVEIEPLGA